MYKLPPLPNLSDSDIPGRIQLEYDGRILYGRYGVESCLAYNALRVTYNGYSKSEIFSNHADIFRIDISKVVMRLFRELLRDNYIFLEQIHTGLPPAVREAAFRYVNEIEDDLPDDDDYCLSDVLVESFGDQPIGSLAHQHVSWLCLNVLKSVIPPWAEACDHPTAEAIFNILLNYLRDGAKVDNWSDLFIAPIPKRNGYRIGDCEAGMLESIADGIANTAKYLRHGQPHVASAVLDHAWVAQDEGAWLHDRKSMSFDQWVVLVALPAAFDCREIDMTSIYK